MELLIQDFFEKHLKKTNIQYKREHKIGNSKIDFIANFDGKTVGVEVKSSYSNVYAAVGQLINFSRYFSHLVLVAPKEFLSKFNELIEETNTLKQIGVIVFENGNFVEIKKPTSTYYFFKEIERIREEKKPYKNEFNRNRFTESEERFFKKFKDRPFTTHNVVENLNKNFGAAYRFILTLRKLGLVEEINIGSHPKSFRITDRLCEMLNLSNRT